MDSPGTNLARAQAFGRLTTRFAKLYDIGVALLPGWGGRLLKAVPHVRGPRVLEVSFGTGYLMSHYAKKCEEVVGVDESEAMLRAARERLHARGLSATLLIGDAQALPLSDDSFDCVVNTDAFSLYSDRALAMREFFRVLRPGGRLVLMEINKPKVDSMGGRLSLWFTRAIGMPMVTDLDALLTDAGFVYEDLNIGAFGVQHLYVATKPER